jgi:hypothetical protein
MTPEQLAIYADIANTLGVVAILLAVVVLFFRGDILSRRVYENLAEKMMCSMVKKVCEEIGEMFEEQRRACKECKE